MPHPPPRFLPHQAIPCVLSNHAYDHGEAREESERRGQPLVPQKLSRCPLILPPPCCPLAKLGTTSLPDLEKLEGERWTRCGEKAEQAWGGAEVTLALLLGPPHLVFPPQLAMCVHVYICICDFSLGLFCVL